MSNIDKHETHDAANAGQADAVPPTRRPRAGPLLPDAGASGASLTAVIAVMAFLAVMAMAGLLIINQAASDWSSDLRSEVTVQIKGISATEISDGVAAARDILSQTQGVIGITELDQREAAALLEPWLGEGNAELFLTIPAIIEVRASPELRANLEPLRQRLSAAVPGASLDDHSTWHDRLASAARSGQALALAIVILIIAAACSISVFAARAGLAANKEIVTVLHLVGATDEFIAREVQRRFFVLGLRGAGTGFLGALLVIGGLMLATRAGVASEAFIPAFNVSATIFLWLLIVPIIACLTTAITARLTVMKTLGEQY